jgi:hypothetical protein
MPDTSFALRYPAPSPGTGRPSVRGARAFAALRALGDGLAIPETRPHVHAATRVSTRMPLTPDGHVAASSAVGRALALVAAALVEQARNEMRDTAQEETR